MQKGTTIVSLSVLLFVSSIGLPSWSADAQKKKLQEARRAQKQMQKQSGQGGLQPPEQGRMDNQRADSGGAGESISMFKAGNTTLPAGTYAMTNVSNGAAFVVIIDDSGDMRAQDARAMNLVDDSTIARNSSKNTRRKNSGPPSGSANNDSDYNDHQYSDSGRSNSDNSNSGQGSPPLLPPQSTPASAVLASPTSTHPLLQGATQSAVYPPQQSGGLVPHLFTGQNPLSSGPAANGLLPGGMQGMPQQKQGGIQGLFNQLNPSAPGQPGSSGIQGKIQAELKRQLTKQLMKQGTGGIEQQVRKMIKF